MNKPSNALIYVKSNQAINIDHIMACAQITFDIFQGALKIFQRCRHALMT